MLLPKPFRAQRARARSIMKFYDCLLDALSMRIFTKSVLLSWPFLPELSMTSIMLYFALWVPTSVLSADMHGNISPVIIYKWYCIDKKSKRPSSQHIRLGMSYGNFNVRPSLCLRIPEIICYDVHMESTGTNHFSSVFDMLQSLAYWRSGWGGALHRITPLYDLTCVVFGTNYGSTTNCGVCVYGRRRTSLW